MPQMMQSSIENQMMSQMLRGATITDSKEQVAQNVWKPEDDERWEVIVLSYCWKKGLPKFKYIIIVKDVGCTQDMPIFVNPINAMVWDLQYGATMVP